MRSKKLFLVFLLVLLFGAIDVACLKGQNVSFAPYEEPSGVEVFGPGILSNNYYQRDLTFAPDGTSLIYSHVIGLGGRAVLVERKIVNGEWSLPQKLPFSNGPYDIEAFYSTDGSKLYFASNRSGSAGFDIWVADRNPDGSWEDPLKLGEAINTAGNEFYPAVDEQGVLYWTAERTGGIGGEDIWMATPEGNAFVDPKPVPGDINTAFDEFNAYVNPRGTRLFFSSFGRSDGNGGGDIYASQRSGDSWTAGVNRGATINTSSLDFCPAFSPGGRYFFFTSEKPIISSGITVPDAFDVSGIARLLSAPGAANIYWKKF